MVRGVARNALQTGTTLAVALQNATDGSRFLTTFGMTRILHGQSVRRRKSRAKAQY